MRLTFGLPSPERPSVLQRLAFVTFGAVGLLWATLPLDWPRHYLPTDTRSQPSHVLAAMLFLGFFSAVFLVVGTVLLVSGALRGRRSGQ